LRTEITSPFTDSSIKDSVKHLIASTYGGNDRRKEVEKIFPIAARKAQIVRELKSREAPGCTWMVICCGLFFDLSISTF